MPDDLLIGFGSRRLIGALLMIVSTALGAQPCFAQGQQAPLRLSDGRVAGKIESISGDTVVVATAGGLKSPVTISDKKLKELWSRVANPPDRKIELSISVKGSADVEFLSSKGVKYVTFSVEMSGGKAKGEVKELTLFTPDETRKPGIKKTAESPDREDSGAAPGESIISGQIKTLKNGVLTVTAPNERGKSQSVTVKLAPGVKVGVLATSMQFVQPGDTIEAKGTTLSQNGQLLPGLLAESVTITLAKTLSGKKGKLPVANDKSGKAAQEPTEVAASREARTTRLTPGDTPIPDAKELAAAERLINEVFKDDLAKAKRPSEKLDIVQKMLEQARQDETEDPERYALLTSAQRIASELGSVSVTLSATEELVTQFKVDVWKIEADIVAKLAEKERADLAQPAIQLASEAADAHRYPEAAQILKAGSTAARAARNADLTHRAKELDARIEHEQKRWNAYGTGLKSLAGNADDPQGNLAVGQFLCFNKGQWSALHYLAKCSDKALVDLATSDIAEPETASDQLALAEQWQTAADSLPSADRAVCQAAAAYWYGRALPGLTGLSKLKAERALEKIGDVPENLRRDDR